MNLSRNFSLLELTKSDTAIRLDIDNNPNADQIEKLKALCENILQPVRDHFGRVKVTSGYRSPELCAAIGSSVNSQHAKAEAADFEVMGTDNAELAARAIDLYKMDAGITSKSEKPKSKDAKKDAAKAVTTTKKGNQVNVTEKKIWTVDEISKLKPYEFDKHEKEIMAARREGRIKRN